MFSIIAVERSQHRIIYVNERRVIKHITTLRGGTAVTTRSVSADEEVRQAACLLPQFVWKRAALPGPFVDVHTPTNAALS